MRYYISLMKKERVVFLLLLLSMLVSIPKISIVKAWTGTVYIRADGSVDPPTAPIQRNGDLYTLTGNISKDTDGSAIIVERDGITIDGASYTLHGPGARREFSYGIYLSGRNNVMIRSIQTEEFWLGIKLSKSSHIIIFGNNMTRHWIGIWLDESSNNTISENNITNSEHSIGLAYSSSNSILRNYIAENTEYGIILSDSSSYNRIVGNNITNNGGGISLDVHEATSLNNSIYHNYFKGNTPQVNVGGGPRHFWDDGYPSGGNYWSDYIGVDLQSGPFQNETGSDGIGDTPYIVDEYTRDRYPLVVLRTSVPAPPVAKFRYSTAFPWTAGKPIILNASYSFVGWNGTHIMPIIEYRWDFGDGNITSTVDPIVIHTYSQAKMYKFTLTVLDSQGLNSSRFERFWIYMPSFLSISTSSSSTFVGFGVGINGTLCDIYKNGLENQTVVLYYTFPGANTWVPITSDTTDQLGKYYVNWIPPATGYFTVKAVWTGNATHFGANNNISLSTIPYQNQYVFSVESNSTISALVFNSTSLELSFTVSGETGTRGYVKVTIAKSLVSNIADVKVYLDGNQTEYSATSQDDACILTFTYTHSTRYVTIDLKTAIITGIPPNLTPWIYLMTALIVIALLSGILIIKRSKQKPSQEEPVVSSGAP